MSYGVVGAGGRAAAGRHHDKPVPDPDDALTKPFWEGANAGKLVVQNCENCGKFHHPPVGLCWNCLSTSLLFQQVSGRGRVHSFAVVKDQRLPAFDALMPYVVAAVNLDDAPGVILLSNIPGTPIAEVHLGMAVAVEFEEIAPGVSIPQFRAA